MKGIGLILVLIFAHIIHSKISNVTFLTHDFVDSSEVDGRVTFESKDGGYFLGGDFVNNDDEDINFLSKFDKYGRKEWSVVIADFLGYYDGIEDNEGNIVLVGNSKGKDEEERPMLVKISEDGNIAWSKVLHLQNYGEIRTITTSFDNSAYLIGGNLDTIRNGSSTIAGFISEIKKTGEIQWIKTIISGEDSRIYSISSSEEGILFTGSTEYDVIYSDVKYRIKNIFYGRLIHNGELDFMYYLKGQNEQSFIGISIFSDEQSEGFIILGRCYLRNMNERLPFETIFFLKVQNNGDIEEFKYLERKNDLSIGISRGTKLNNGNFVVTGWTLSYKRSEYSKYDIMFLGIDANGLILFGKRIGDYDRSTSRQENWSDFASPTSDGGFLITYYASCFNSSIISGGMMKFNENATLYCLSNSSSSIQNSTSTPVFYDEQFVNGYNYVILEDSINYTQTNAKDLLIFIDETLDLVYNDTTSSYSVIKIDGKANLICLDYDGEEDVFLPDFSLFVIIIFVVVYNIIFVLILAILFIFILFRNSKSNLPNEIIEEKEMEEKKKEKSEANSIGEEKNQN